MLKQEGNLARWQCRGEPHTTVVLHANNWPRAETVWNSCAHMFQTEVQGKHLKAGRLGFAMRSASRWKRPSATNTMVWMWSGSVGAVQPSVSPPDKGLACGMNRFS